MPNKANKKPSRKMEAGEVWKDGSVWVIKHGRLIPPRGRPAKVKSLLGWVGEKIPFEALQPVQKLVEQSGSRIDGVYIAHDSMGFARYVGRGNVFKRLDARKKAQPRELAYFSFYIVAEKKHEREIETLLIRVGGAHLHFNERKKRIDIEAGNVNDYEAGTSYVERQRKRGRTKAVKRGRKRKTG